MKFSIFFLAALIAAIPVEFSTSEILLKYEALKEAGNNFLAMFQPYRLYPTVEPSASHSLNLAAVPAVPHTSIPAPRVIHPYPPPKVAKPITNLATVEKTAASQTRPRLTRNGLDRDQVRELKLIGYTNEEIIYIYPEGFKQIMDEYYGIKESVKKVNRWLKNPKNQFGAIL